MSFDPTNPFANTGAVPATVAGIQPKLGTETDLITMTPVVPPGGFTQYFAVADRANILFSLAYVVNGIANGQFLTLNTTQVNAISNIYTAWSATDPYGASLPGNVTVPQSGLQNTVIAMQAINYLQTTGLLTTTQDLEDSNGQIQLVTGFAPNGASTLTIHNQKVLCALPNSDFWYASNVGTANNWNPLSAGDMETYSDQPLAMDQCYGFAVAFGAQSMEWYQDTGAQPFPYVIIPGAAYEVGLPAVFSRAHFMGNIVFLGRYKTGQMHVMQTNGTGMPVIVSTQDIDQIINSFTQYQDAVASTDDFNGHPVFILTFISAKRTFLLDGITQIWSELQSGTAEYQRHLCTLRCTLNNGTLASDYESGNVYVVDPNNYTDNGYIIKREWVSKRIINNGNIFSVPYLELLMEVGTGAQKAAPVSPTQPVLDAAFLSAQNSGFSDGSGASGLSAGGSLTPATINGFTVSDLFYSHFSASKFIYLYLYGADATFDAISFTDQEGNTVTLLANAAQQTPFTSPEPGISFVWGATEPAFTANNSYTINVLPTGNTTPGSLPVPLTSTPHVELFVSTDGGNTWSDPQAAELGEVGQYNQRVYWRQLGTGRTFHFKFRCTDPVPFIVVAGYATIVPGQPD